MSPTENTSRKLILSKPVVGFHYQEQLKIRANCQQITVMPAHFGEYPDL